MALLTGSFGLIPVILLIAYVVAIVPSTIFTALLELAFWRGLDPMSPKASLLAGGLGLASGLAIGLAPGVPTAAEKAFVFGLLGVDRRHEHCAPRPVEVRSGGCPALQAERTPPPRHHLQPSQSAPRRHG